MNMNMITHPDVSVSLARRIGFHADSSDGPHAAQLQTPHHDNINPHNHIRVISGQRGISLTIIIAIIFFSIEKHINTADEI